MPSRRSRKVAAANNSSLPRVIGVCACLLLTGILFGSHALLPSSGGIDDDGGPESSHLLRVSGHTAGKFSESYAASLALQLDAKGVHTKRLGIGEEHHSPPRHLTHEIPGVVARARAELSTFRNIVEEKFDHLHEHASAPTKSGAAPHDLAAATTAESTGPAALNFGKKGAPPSHTISSGASAAGVGAPTGASADLLAAATDSRTNQALMAELLRSATSDVSKVNGAESRAVVAGSAGSNSNGRSQALGSTTAAVASSNLLETHRPPPRPLPPPPPPPPPPPQQQLGMAPPAFDNIVGLQPPLSPQPPQQQALPAIDDLYYASEAAAEAADTAAAATALQVAVDALGAPVVHSAPPTWRRSLGEDPSFAAAVKSALTAWQQADASPQGPIERYLANGGRLPVAVLAANRADMLEQALTSLVGAAQAPFRSGGGRAPAAAAAAAGAKDGSTAMGGVRKLGLVVVLQDGSDASVAAVARAFENRRSSSSSSGSGQVMLRQHLRQQPLLRGAHSGEVDWKSNGAKRIAEQYKWALTEAFRAAPDAPAIVVAEDDFLFSPDFLEYFEATAPLLERDKSTFVVSAWNDNGLRGKVYDKRALCRTGFFPGLGWLLPRALFETELAPHWPKEHWDHWMRDAKQHKGREAVYPEVNRAYHAGKKGTFMDDFHHNRYFKDIDYNVDRSFSWTSGVNHSSSSSSSSYGVSGGAGANSMSSFGVFLRTQSGMAVEPWAPSAGFWASSPVYEARIEAVLRNVRTKHLSELADLSLVEAERWESVVLWHDTDFSKLFDPKPAFKAMADYFHIWHEWYRTAHAGCLHHFRFGGDANRPPAEVFLVNVQDFPSGNKDGHASVCRYRALKPPNARVFQPHDFAGLSRPPLPAAELKGLVMVGAPTKGQNCDDVCHAHVPSSTDLGAAQAPPPPKRGYVCEPRAFDMVNNCAALTKELPCETGCESSYGLEQPAYVEPDSPKDALPGRCLFSTKVADTTCHTSHPLTRRICPCVPRRGTGP